ncbi:hypothetical protein B0H63DRAFT_107437 [Podospora didyma]|uniref:PHD-type domain-containing protein n=1 Tax=Podospora didyma TaxID=330526 RepID=A0AAE0U4B2_9PEZI|nr:hypothetical protein B0H63DRAFT_107437 [Podospora didyma]
MRTTYLNPQRGQAISMLDSTNPHDAALAIQEWQQRNSHDHDLKPDDRSVTARLCDGILTLFQEVIRQVSKQSVHEDQTIPKPVQISLERARGFIALWSDGYGIRDGAMDDVLAKSRNIRHSTVKTLSSIADALLNRLIPLSHISSDRLEVFKDQLAATNAEACYILHEDDGSEASSDALSELGLEDSVAEVAEDLKTDAQCLMELDPLFRNPVLDLSSLKQKRPLHLIEWAPEKAYCDKVQQRFPRAEGSLVERLGEANWVRYLRCQEQRNSTDTQLRDREVVARQDDEQTVAASSKYHDSGLGTSLPTASSYAETIMTYGGGDGQKIRIPPLSAESKGGKPFPCVACGKTVRIMNNSAWKRHLYLDLQPYLCLETNCFQLAFNNRKDWISHLGLDHRYEPVWDAITCPLCFEDTERGKIAITTHLARHLEEISLSALPANPDDDECDDVSEASAASTSSGAVSEGNTAEHNKLRTKQDRNGNKIGYCERCETWKGISEFNMLKVAGGPIAALIEPACEECWANMKPEVKLDKGDEKDDDVESEEAVRCVCGFDDYPGPIPEDDLADAANKDDDDMAGFFIQCDSCKIWQHGACIGFTSETEAPDEYHCEQCQPALHSVQISKNGRKYSKYRPLRILSVKAASRSKLDSPTHLTSHVSGNETQMTFNVKDSSSGEKYCLCQEEERGKMVNCGDSACPYQWFHFGCVGLDSNSTPVENWICPLCTGRRATKNVAPPGDGITLPSPSQDHDPIADTHERLENGVKSRLPAPLSNTGSNTGPRTTRRLDAHGQTSLARACAKGDYATVLERFRERREDINVADYAGNTPLHIAALNGYSDIVKLLIDAGSNLECVNNDKDAPLLDAVENGHLHVVKLLLAAGVNPLKGNAFGEKPIDRVNEDDEHADAIRQALKEAQDRRRPRHIPGLPEEESRKQAAMKEIEEDEPYTIKCICNVADDDGNTIYCEKCDTWQHIECYYPNNVDDALHEDFAHSCVECEPRWLDRQRAMNRLKEVGLTIGEVRRGTKQKHPPPSESDEKTRSQPVSSKKAADRPGDPKQAE